MYKWVNNYIGIPFVSGGRDKTGCDCYGLVRLILQNEYNIELPLLSSDYINALNIAETKKLFSDYIPIFCGNKISTPTESSVALMRFRGTLCHVGVWAGDNYIIHTRHKTGSVCERIDRFSFAGFIEGWYEIDKNYCTVKSVLNR